METQKAGVWATGTLNNPRSVSNLAYKGREPLGYLSQPRATPKFLGLREAFPGPGEAREPLPARPTRAQGPARTHLGRRPASAAPEPGPTPPGPQTTLRAPQPHASDHSPSPGRGTRPVEARPPRAPRDSRRSPRPEPRRLPVFALVFLFLPHRLSAALVAPAPRFGVSQTHCLPADSNARSARSPSRRRLSHPALHRPAHWDRAHMV